ncbi:MAG: M15 family metallopeptidase [Lachnospiraceae bacterium]|nr:M15 family metallopeptidase [Lachnospiraceae bacterium]
MKTGLKILFIVCLFLCLAGCAGREEKPVTEEVKEEAAGPVIKVTNEIGDSISSDRTGEDMTGEAEETGETEEAGSEEEPEETGEDESVDAFYITEIDDDLFDRIYGKSFKEDCTLPREDLRYLHVLHKDKDLITHEGEMIVNKAIAQDVLDILKELYENDYPIEKIRLVDEYGADDEASMEDNNSSSFNYRTVPGSKKLSKHAMGMAVDINTRYNPYIRTRDGQTLISPDNGVEYADRAGDFDYKIEKGDLCYTLFKEHGFEWGGEWKNSKDFQHFEKPD